MSTPNEDFWPDDLMEGIPTTPKDILQYQAAKLGEKTRNLITGEIETRVAKDGDFVHKLLICIPSLNNYKYELMWVFHGISLYPVTDDDNIEYNTEASFKGFVREKLSSPDTIKLIKAFISQAKGVRDAADGDIPV